MRVVHGVALALVAAAAAAMLLLGGALGLLRTAWGSGRVRNAVVARANQRIAGDLKIGQLRVTPYEIVLRDVVLRDPGGVVVAQVPKLEMRYDLFALFHRRLDVRELDLEHPTVRLAPAADGAGLNLSRALASRQPHAASPAPPASFAGKQQGGSGWSVHLGHLGLVDGGIAYWPAPLPAKGRRPALDLTDLRLSGSGGFTPGGAFGARLRATGDSRAMAPGRLAMEVRAHGEAGVVRTAAGRLALGDTIRVRAQRPPSGPWNIDLDRLRVTPALARTFAPRYPLRTTVTGRGTLEMAPRRIAGTLALRTAGNGLLRARGGLDPVTLETSRGIQVEARGLNAGELLDPGMPSAPVLFHLNVRPGSLAPSHLSGRLALEIGAVHLARHRFGPVRLNASVRAGNIQQLQLDARLPGAHLTAHARGPVGRVSGRAMLAISDGSRVAAALAALVGRAPPAVGGRGEVHLDAAGSLIAGLPSLKLAMRAMVPTLRLGATQRGRRLEGLNVSARLGPEQAGGARDFQLAVGLQQPARTAIDARGDVRLKAGEATLARLTVNYPGAQWVSAGRAHAHLLARNGRTRLRGLRLSSGRQRLALDFARTGQQTVAHLDVTQLRLDRLPPPFRKLARIPGPLTGGADVRATSSRLKAEVHAKVPWATLQARVDVPTRWPPPLAAPFSVSAQLSDVRLAALPPQLVGWRAGTVTGDLAANLRLSGSARDPVLVLVARARDLSAPPRALPGPTPASGVGAGRLDVHLTYDDQRARLRLDAQDLDGGTLAASATVPVDLSWPAVQRLAQADVRAALPVQGHLRAHGFRAAWLSTLSQRLRGVRGRLDGEATIEGRLGGPRVDGRLSWHRGGIVVGPARTGR